MKNQREVTSAIYVERNTQSKESYMGHYKGYCQPLNILKWTSSYPIQPTSSLGYR